MGMTTKRIASFVVETSYRQIPEEAVRIAKQAILDCLGTSMAGAKKPTGEIITKYVKEIGSKPEAGVITKGFKASAPLAALANGTMAHALNYDDLTRSWQGHPTVVLMPTVLALGEKGKLSGKAVLEAYILGFEVAAKVGQGLGPGNRTGGWHTSSETHTEGKACFPRGNGRAREGFLYTRGDS